MDDPGTTAPPPNSLDDEIRAEQRAVDRAYERLGAMRESALDVVRHHRELGATTTGQARVEWESLLALTDQRLNHLELGGAALCFGRIDTVEAESYQVGRISILDEAGDPLVIDWRAPAAEPFYRATGRDPMGLVRRRHLLTRGRRVVDIDDEVFDLDRADGARLGVVGEGALLAALGRSRTGRMGDIVATIQAEQDLVIRAPFPGILIVQGGPGTGKTAVALHRAAYLLYANRQRLEDAGVLVVGPNRTFLRYIEHVLPSLGENGVGLVTVDGLYGRVPVTGEDTPEAERTKGDARMVRVLRNAVSDRERVLPDDLRVPYGTRVIRVRRVELQRIVDQVRQRPGTHNERRAVFARRLRRALWRNYRPHVRAGLDRLPAELPLDADDDLDPLDVVRSSALALEREEENFLAGIGRTPEVRAALERMWPLLTPEELLNDLFGSPGLLRLATAGVLDDPERDALRRPRSTDVGRVAWTTADVALLDEAATLLGPLPSRVQKRRREQLRENARWRIEETVADITLQTGELDATMRRQLVERLTDREQAALAEDEDEAFPPVFGHVIVDEAQDLSAMQWRAVARRCPNGSMTIVGDLGQASRPAALTTWNDALAHLPARREPRRAELTVNYRTPTEIMEVAAAILAHTDPGLTPPSSVRSAGIRPRVTATNAAELPGAVAAAAARALAVVGDGRLAVIVPDDLREGIRGALTRAGLPLATGGDTLETPVAVYSATETKGLEFDGVVVVEPAAVAGETMAGLRSLYVALTRATRVLEIVHHAPLPEPMR